MSVTLHKNTIIYMIVFSITGLIEAGDELIYKTKIIFLFSNKSGRRQFFLNSFQILCRIIIPQKIHCL